MAVSPKNMAVYYLKNWLIWYTLIVLYANGHLVLQNIHVLVNWALYIQILFWSILDLKYQLWIKILADQYIFYYLLL